MMGISSSLVLYELPSLVPKNRSKLSMAKCEWVQNGSAPPGRLFFTPVGGIDLGKETGPGEAFLGLHCFESKQSSFCCLWRVASWICGEFFQRIGPL